MELIEEIQDFEYDEDEETPLEFRMYEEGRTLLETITKKIYPNEENRYVQFLESENLVELDNIEEDFMITIKTV